MSDLQKHDGARSAVAALADGPPGASRSDAEPRMVIVPRRPGLIREHEPRRQRPRDELDDLIDELFGPTTDEKPGRFDAGLVVVGLGLAGWNFILGGPSAALWVGIAAIVLGLALPLRELLRRIEWPPSRGFGRRIADRGLRLDASHSATVALVDAYSHLVQMSCLQGTGDAKRAIAAGHMALTEAAVRLDGRPPDSPAKVRFVSVRTEAVEALTRQMLRAHDRWVARAAKESRVPGGSGAPESRATARWAPLDALARTSAIAELEKLNSQLRKEIARGER